MIRSGILSVAVFNCGYTSPSIQQHRGQYDDIFRSLLQPAFDRVCATKPGLNSELKLSIRGYDTVNGVYPVSLEGLDAIVVSGSPNGAYQDLEWIRKLDRYIACVYSQHPSIKLYGSCFGHQIICQALFSGATVEKDPCGWELGVRDIELSEEFVTSFAKLLPSKSLRLQFLHGDHVVLPTDCLPKDIYLIGSTSHCQVQGIHQPGRILTLQGHPEFDQFIETECLHLVGKRVGWESEFTESAIAAAQLADDSSIAADVIIEFFLNPEA
ncbi:hypothetical protein G7046_g3760 [Stylonectria norvegica]|nr:hypothetical protein G7046_g3760 [Stylonectria norvegica]